jgi:hypothetical protein
MVLSFIHNDTSVAERLVFTRDTGERKQRLAAELQRLSSILYVESFVDEHSSYNEILTERVRGNEASVGSERSRL